MAVLAARALKRWVRVSLPHRQMFSFAYRPATLQHIGLGTSADGKREAVIHEVLAETARFVKYPAFKPRDFHVKTLGQVFEPVIAWGGALRALQEKPA